MPLNPIGPKNNSAGSIGLSRRCVEQLHRGPVVPFGIADSRMFAARTIANAPLARNQRTGLFLLTLSNYLGFAKKTESPSELGEVSINLTKMGFVHEARKLMNKALRQLERVPPILFDLKSKILDGIIRDLIKMGEMDKALGLAQEHEYLDKQADIVKIVAKKGETERAIEMARNFESHFWRCVTQCKVAEVLAERGEKKKALEVLDEALGSMKEIESSVEKIAAQIDIARSLKKAGEEERAIEIVGPIPFSDFNKPYLFFDEVIINIEKVPPNLARIGKVKEAVDLAKTLKDNSAIRKIAHILAKRGEIREAQSLIKHVEGRLEKSKLCKDIAQAHMVKGEREDAIAAINIALKFVKKHKSGFEHQKYEALIEIALLLTRIGETEKALELFKDVEAYWRSRGQIRVSQVLFEIGESKGASRLVREAIKIAEQLEQVNKNVPLKEGSLVLAMLGEYEEAQIVTRKIKVPSPRFDAQIKLAQALMEKGEKEKAVEVVEEAKEAIREFQFSDHKFEAQIKVAQFLIRLGKAERAASVIDDSLTLGRRLSGESHIHKIAISLFELDPEILSEERIQSFLKEFSLERYSPAEYLALADTLCFVNRKLIEPVIADGLTRNIEFLRQNLQSIENISERYNLSDVRAAAKFVGINPGVSSKNFWANLVKKYSALKEKYIARHKKMSGLRHRDAHVHTALSSGAHSLKEVIIHAVNQGVATLVPTDHNTIRGVAESLRLAKEYDIDITFGGVEIKCFYNGKEVHVKVFFDPQSKEIEGIVEDIQDGLSTIARDQLRDMKRIDTKKRLSQFFEMNDLDSKSIFEGIRESPFCRDENLTDENIVDTLLKVFDRGRNLSTAALKDIINQSTTRNIAEAFLAHGLFAARDREYNIFRDFFALCSRPYLDDAQELNIYSVLHRFNEAEAWASIAHPELTARKGLGKEKMDEMITDLAQRKLIKSIEVMYPFHEKETVDYYSELADRLGLEKDGGTDFHDITREEATGSIGRGIHYNVDVSFEFFEAVRDFLAKPYLEKGQRYFEGRNYLNAFLEFNRVISLAPYKFEIYDYMIECCLQIARAKETWIDFLLDQTKTPRDRVEVARLLRYFPHEEIVPYYIKVLEERHAPDLQREVVSILGELNCPEATPVLKRIAENVSQNYLPDVVEEAKRSLAKISNTTSFDPE